MSALVALTMGCVTRTPEEIEARNEMRAAKSSIRRIERLLMKDYKKPQKEDLSDFLDALRKLDREVAAEAFSEFLSRYEVGLPTYEKPSLEYQRACKKAQIGGKLIRSWGNGGYLPDTGRFPIGTIAAVYKISLDGKIHDIRVLVAKHPGAAWLIIDTLAESRISKSRLKRMVSDAPEIFPVSLCAWWDYNEIRQKIPEANTIRGMD